MEVSNPIPPISASANASSLLSTLSLSSPSPIHLSPLSSASPSLQRPTSPVPEPTSPVVQLAVGEFLHAISACRYASPMILDDCLRTFLEPPAMSLGACSLVTDTQWSQLNAAYNGEP
jgi:hypothetical protein